jgi:sigma-54 specific flagellar transcriptional regulator A
MAQVALKNSEMSETVLINKFSMSQDVNLKEMLYQIEHSFIKEALEKTNGIVSHAAEKLGMRRTTLIEKMKKFSIEK